MHGMHPFNAIIVFDPTGSARRLIMAFDKLRHQVRDREYRPQYEEKLAMAARHPEVWVKRLAVILPILSFLVAHHLIIVLSIYPDLKQIGKGNEGRVEE